MASRAANDEYDFDDDDAFDELPANTLYQLEEQAFLNTQQPRTGLQQSGVPQKQQYVQPPSSDYGSGEYEEEDVIDLNAAPISLPTKAVPTRQHHAAQYNKPFRSLRGLNGVQRPQIAASQSNGGLSGSQPSLISQVSQRGGVDGIDVQALLAQVEELRQQNEALQQASRDNQAAAQQKAGEAANLRRKIETTSSEFEKRLQREKETHTHAFNQQKAQLELAIREKKQMEANNLFLENEAKQAHEAAIPRKTALGARDTSAGRSRSFKQAGTPKRTDPSLPFRDGFDDEDLVIVSPSRAQKKQGTPKKANKRKRSIDQSPAKIGSLDFAEPVGSPAVSFSREDSERTTVITSPAKNRPSADDQHYVLLQKLLNHVPLPYSEDRFIEAMAGFTLPSQSTKLSSSIMTSLQTLPESVRMEIHVVRVLASAWRKCLDDVYYAPINALVETMQYLMQIHRTATTVQLRHEVVPLVTRTVDLVAIPLGLASRDGSALPDEIAAIDKQVDVQQCLELLSYVCMACARTRSAPKREPPESGPVPVEIGPDPPVSALSPVEDFWRMLQFDFVLVLLMRAQSKNAMRTILSMLPLSCLASTFGTVVPKGIDEIDTEKQRKREDNTLHRLLDLLFENPKPPKGREDQAWDDADLARLRQDVLVIFSSMCYIHPGTRSKQSHGSTLLAQHPRAIGKLFRFLSDSINLLYTYPPPPLQHFTNQAEDEVTPHALTAQTINTTMRILYHLITTFNKEIDLRQKLAATPGGHHRHLVALSRLAFSDQMFLDAGIEDATIDAAHDMLDNFLTYEEGESLVTLFSTPVTKAANSTNDVAELTEAAAAANEGVAQVDGAGDVAPNDDKEMS